MSKPAPRDVTLEYNTAAHAAKRYEPGQQPDIYAKMKAAYILGYQQALIDYDVVSMVNQHE